MTDAEKMLHLMMELSKENNLRQQSDFNTFARLMKMSYDSFLQVGFTPREALEMNKEIIRSAMMSNGTKK